MQVGISKLGSTEIHLSTRVSKLMGHTIATISLPRSYCQTYSGYPKEWFFVFQQDSAPAHRACDTVAFLEQRVPDFIPATLWPQNSPDLNPFDYSIWSVLQEKVYRSRIANVDELKTRLIDEWGRLDQSIVDAAIDQWHRRLSACVQGRPSPPEAMMHFHPVSQISNFPTIFPVLVHFPSVSRKLLSPLLSKMSPLFSINSPAFYLLYVF